MHSLILFEDADLLVVHKPSGVNTHKPDRFAPDGLHEWLQKHRGRGIPAPTGRDKNVAPTSSLSILHRLDKDTSGVLVFGKTRRANQSLARQFEQHLVKKEYLLLAAAKPSRARFQAQSFQAVTEFEYAEPCGRWFLVEARPITGKTHQIRRHAQENGFSIVGDTEYGGIPAPRLMLHAHQLQFRHPATDELVTFEASIPQAFETPDPLTVAREYRALLFGDDTNAYRLINGAADGVPDVVVDSYDGRLLVQWQTEQTQPELLEQLGPVVEQFATKHKRTVPVAEGRASARLPVAEDRARGSVPLRFPVMENGLKYLVNFGEGLGTGLFADQRENRWRLAGMPLAGKTVLNCFAYTCAFSVAAAKAGALTTSVDLSRNYLEWGKENFRANGLECGGLTPPSEDTESGKALSSQPRSERGQRAPKHDFIFGDVFDWLRQFGKRSRQWDVVLLDPPTFSTTKGGRVFRAARDYGELVALAVPLVKPDGWLFCSTNQRTLPADEFETTLIKTADAAGRFIEELEFESVPFDFRVAAGERTYLKTLWARLR
jgi:23S rRNA (cytosine1962-C5)-methyltransferase